VKSLAKVVQIRGASQIKECCPKLQANVCKPLVCRPCAYVHVRVCKKNKDSPNQGVFQIRKSKLRAYVLSDPAAEQCMRRSVVPQD
jgi:hypothetical protein